MANFLSNLMSSLKLREDDDDEYDEYVREQEEKERKRTERPSRNAEMVDRYVENRPSYREESGSKASYSQSAASIAGSEQRGTRPVKQERLGSGKVIPIRTTAKGFEVCVMRPTSFEDSQDICDMLLSGRATVINLEGFDVDVAQRIMDFVSGAVYSVSGRLHQISSYIFIVSPDSVDVSGDYLDMIAQNGFEVPTLNKEF